MGDVAGYRLPPIYEQPSWWAGETYALEDGVPAAEPPAAAVLNDACWWAPEECGLPLEPIVAAAHPLDEAYARLVADLPCITTDDECTLEQRAGLGPAALALQSSDFDVEELAMRDCWWDQECEAFA